MILFVFIVICSCGQHGNKQNIFDLSGTITINYFQTKDILFEEFFDFSQAQMIQIKAPESYIFGSKLKIQIGTENIFVFDETNTQMFRFSLKGDFINAIGGKGKGPAEYMNVIDFNIDDKAKVIDFLSESGMRMKVFDYDGGYLRRFEPPPGVMSFTKVHNNLYWFYVGYAGFHDNYRLVLADSLMVIDSKLPLKTNAFDVNEYNFNKGGKEIFFRESFLPVIYKIDSVRLKAQILFDFGEFSITEEDLSKVKDPFVFFEQFKSNGYITTTDAIGNDGYIAIRTLKEEQMELSISDFIIDRQDSTVIRISYSRPGFYDLSKVKSLIHIDETSHFYFAIDSFSFNEFKEQQPDVFPKDFVSEPHAGSIVIIKAQPRKMPL